VLEKKMRGEVTEMATSSTPKRQLRNLPRAPLIKLINPRFVLAVLPVIVFWLTHRVASTELAIGMGFAVSLLVFFTNRHRGAIGLLAILGITTVGGAAIIAIVIGSARAYLATDPIGDILQASSSRDLCLGCWAQELVPVVQRFLDPRHQVFFLTTWLIVIVNGLQRAS
jgi:hypothetical protein